MVYRMIFNQTAYFGRGAIKEIPGVARSHGFTKAFIVTDPVLLETGTVKKVTDVLDEAGMPYEVFDNVKPNPPVECIQDGVAKFAASGADFLIGLGGGSPQDTCKGIGIVTANPEFADVLSLEGVADTKNPSVPIFGVPTTAGTASETTINYVITDTANKRKFVAVDPHDIPIVAFVDPDLTDSMPRGLKVATGLDALTNHINRKIDKYDHRCDIQHDRLHNRIIAVGDRADQKSSDSRHAEHLLRHDAAGKDLRDYHRKERHNRNHRIFQHMPVQYRRFRIAAAVGSPHVFPVHLGQNRASQEFHHHRNLRQRHRERWK